MVDSATAKREKKLLFLEEKKKKFQHENFSKKTKHFFFQSIALFIPNSIHQADDYF